MSEFVNVTVKTFLPSAKSIEGMDMVPALYKASETVMNTMVDLVPVDTGHLKSLIHIEIPDEHTGFVGVDETGEEEQYAVYQEYGTGEHAEGPGGSKAKKIPWVYYNKRDGKFYLTYGVHATHFMEHSLDWNRIEVEEILTEAVKEELVKLFGGR